MFAEAEEAADSCQAKSDGYKRSRSTRVFAIAVSPDEAGEDALDWLMNELAEDGDEIVAIRVLELDEDGESSPTLPLSTSKTSAHPGDPIASRHDGAADDGRSTADLSRTSRPRCARPHARGSACASGEYPGEE